MNRKLYMMKEQKNNNKGIIPEGVAPSEEIPVDCNCSVTLSASFAFDTAHQNK